jgi:hypothetical protein
MRRLALPASRALAAREQLLSRVAVHPGFEGYFGIRERAKAAVETVTVGELLGYGFCRCITHADELALLLRTRPPESNGCPGDATDPLAKPLADCTIAEAALVPATGWPLGAGVLREVFVAMQKTTRDPLPAKVPHVHGHPLTFDMLSSSIVGAAHRRVFDDAKPLFLTSVPRNSKSAILQAVGRFVANELGYVSVFILYHLVMLSRSSKRVKTCWIF